MPTFQIELDDGRKLRIEADNQEAALAGVEHFRGGGPTGAPSAAMDVVKQVPRLATTGIENIVTGPAKLARAGADLVGAELPNPTVSGWEQRLRSYIPGLTTKDTSAPERRLSDLISEQGGDRGVGQYLPEPQTPAGQVAKSAFETVPSAMLLPGGVGANAAIGALTGGASEAVGQKVDELAPEAPHLGTIARVGTSVLGGGLLSAPVNAAARRRVSGLVPTLENLDEGSDAARTAAGRLGVTLDPTTTSRDIGQIQNRLLRGPSVNGAPVYGTEEAIPITHRLLGAKQTEYAPNAPQGTAQQLGLVPVPQKAPVTLDDIDTFRKTLGAVANKNPSGAERAAARAAKRAADDLVNPGNALTGDAAEAARLLARARADEAAGFRAENVLGRIESGELRQGASTGPNVSAGRQEIRKLISPEPGGLRTKAQKAGYDLPEQAQMRHITMGDTLENVLRSAGATYASGGLGATAGLGAWYQTGDPTWLALAGIVPAARGGLQALTRGITRKQERILAEMVQSRSPEGYRRWMEAPEHWRNRITSPIRRLTSGVTGGILGLNTGYQQLLRDPNDEGED